MRTITLNKMRIENFKGIQNFEIDFDGKNTLISGFNGVGKSTIADAYFWATTGKNIALSTRFEVRPRNEQGNEVHDVITSVEIEFTVFENLCTPLTFTIRRDECEDLTKKERELLKPETIAKKRSYYFIDGAPYDAKIFYDKIAGLMCDKDKFTVLSNPFAFFALEEKQQRDLLTSACGDVQDSEIEDYEEVNAICGPVVNPIEKRDALKKLISSTQKRLDEIPARVDSLSGLCDEYADYDKQVAELADKRLKFVEQNQVAYEKLQQCFSNQVQAIEEPSKREILDYEYQIKDIERGIAAEQKVLEIIEQSIEKNTCPNCGYDMGSRAAEKPLCEKNIAEKQRSLLIYQECLRQAQAEYDKDMQEYNAKVAAQKQTDETALQTRKTLEAQIDEYRKQYTDLSVEIEKLCQAQKVQSQIKQLRDEQKKLDGELADSMTKFDIISAFILKKAESSVENINKRFKTVRFKLFEMQTNGELKPCCKATVDGVSYANINTAKKVQVGIELANLFSDYLAVKCPLWVDNKESVFELGDVNTQLILLKADEQYKELHILQV